ncbi:MAG: epoxyqueuosine reductase QueH [Clostridia bacterium]|nr:epoxyqueuosine reductase QueH [Clostridia bacterium]
MAGKINYQLVLDQTLKEIMNTNTVPTLLLHSCCAPCSSYCLEYLSDYFSITVLYYNPNIEDEEFERRYNEQIRLVSELKTEHPVRVVKGEHDTGVYYELVAGHEDDPEGGERCRLCFELRLEEAAKYAKENGFDYFTTTLSISPLKNAELLNSIGREMSERYGVEYLYSDFKKKNGYLRSIELSNEYSLYRQDYCGCIYSIRKKLPE